MSPKYLGLLGLTVAGVLLAIAFAKKLLVLGLIAAAVYFVAIRPFRRSRSGDIGGGR
jgi:hypothetical protein